PHGTDKKTVHEWMDQQVKAGKDYQESSPGYEELEEAIRLLSGTPSEPLALKQKNEGYSKLRTARLKRNIKEMVNSLSDIRYTPGFHSDSNDTQSQAELLNRVAYSWYVDRFIDTKIKKAVQWMAITPCGWLEICYRQIPGERDRKEIDCVPHSFFDVVMSGVPDSGDHQEAYTVTIIKDLPVYLAHALWPKHQHVLIPDRESPKGWRERIKEVYDAVFSEGPQKKTAQNPTVRMYYQYVLDLSINETKTEMKMGFEEGRPTPWSYIVPYVGQPIPKGYDENNTPIYRLATVEDARLFPGRRLIVGTDSVCIYDGPMFDWHGKVPLVKFCADSWPFGDFSMVHDTANIQDTI